MPVRRAAQGLIWLTCRRPRPRAGRSCPDLRGGSPWAMPSTRSMPSVTSPHTVYWPSRKRASAKQMKNWLSPLFGFCERAMPTVPRLNGVLVNSAAQLLARAAHAGAGRIAGLRHEAVDHAMEHDAVVEPVARQLLDALDMVGREIGPQLDDDAAAVEIEMELIFARVVRRAGAVRGHGRVPSSGGYRRRIVHGTARRARPGEGAQ